MDDEHRNHKGCFCFQSVTQNWLTSTGKKHSREHKWTCSSAKPTDLFDVSPKALVGSQNASDLNHYSLHLSVWCSAHCACLCFPLFIFILMFLLFLFFLHWESFWMSATGSWVAAPPPGKSYYRLHRNVITLLPLSHEWNKRIFNFFGLVRIHWNPACLTIRSLPIKLL